MTRSTAAGRLLVPEVAALVGITLTSILFSVCSGVMALGCTTSQPPDTNTEASGSTGATCRFGISAFQTFPRLSRRLSRGPVQTRGYPVVQFKRRAGADFDCFPEHGKTRTLNNRTIVAEGCGQTGTHIYV